MVQWERTTEVERVERTRSEDDALVLAARAGDDDAFAELVDRWLDRCWEVAWRILRDRDLAADAAQETLATAWERLATLDRPESFGGWVLRIARNRALNRLDRERRTVATADERALEPTDRLVAADGPEEIIERDDRASLLWAASAALGPRDSSVLDLHLRHGMGPPELAEALGVTANNAHQLLFRLRTRLGGAIRAHVLWRDGDPRCEDLTAALRSAGVTTFGPSAVRTISRHAGGCATCDDDRAAVLAPTALFGGVPLVAMPAPQRDAVLARLGRRDVPVPDATTATGGPTAPGGGPPDRWPAGAAAADPPDAAPGRHRRRTAVATAAAAAVVLVAIALAAQGAGRATDTLVAGAGPAGTASTTDAATATVSAPALGPPAATTPTAVAPAAPTPTAGAPPPPTAGAGPADPAPTPPAPAPTTTPARPTTAPPAASPPPGSTTSTTVTPAPTAVLRVTEDPHPSCSLARLVTWTTTDATAVTLAVAGGPPAAVAASGSTTVCESPGRPVTLTASGPGGTTVADAAT